MRGKKVREEGGGRSSSREGEEGGMRWVKHKSYQIPDLVVPTTIEQETKRSRTE